MFGFLKIKVVLIGMLVASPSLAAWMIRSTQPPLSPAQPVVQEQPDASTDAPVQVAVEIVSKGSASQWIYVQVPNRQVPEPGSVSLLVLASLMALRRQRK